MRAHRRRVVMMVVMMVLMVLVVIVYSSISLLTPAQGTNIIPRGTQTDNKEEEEEEDRRRIIPWREEEVEEEGEEERRKRRQEEEGRDTGGRSEIMKKMKEEKEEEEKRKKEEDTKPRGGGGGGGGRFIRKDFWVDEMEVHSPPPVNMEEMEEEMRRRRRRVEERCPEILTEEEREMEINSQEFLINKPYKLIWCNIFKSASSTWMYNYLRMGGKTPRELQNLHISPVEAARKLYPRPSLSELRAYLGDGRGKGETRGGGDGDAGSGLGGDGGGYLSFIIVREPFQRLLSAYRDKIEKQVPYYRPLRCEMTKESYVPAALRVLSRRRNCSPTFPQFVEYVLGVERRGGSHNEHWAPYYRFCTPCSAHFDLILRFENLHEDEVYLLEKVPGLKDVVSPKVMHSSHANYSSLLVNYYKQLSPDQLLGLIKMYLPDFWLFGYNERPYVDMVL